jgi:3-phosphoshikimate 1-carboxyvinyltransferase
VFPPGPLTLTPLASPPTVVWRVPGSKSITNRALVLAALAEGESTLRGVLHSDDTKHMVGALRALGVAIVELDDTTLRVSGGLGALRAPDAPLFVGNSGTTVRFLTALACLVPGPVTLRGDEHMAKRPISDLVDGLRQLGVRVDCETGCPPLTVYGGSLPGGKVVMRGDRSSQYFSALLMAAGGALAPLDIELDGELVSRPYVDITLNMLRAFGGHAHDKAGGFWVEAQEGYRASDYTVEPDASSASYAFATAAATGGQVDVPGLTAASMQGDYAFTELLARAGATVVSDAGKTRVTGGARLCGLDVDMHHISDTVMTLAALAPLASGPTRISNVANIRIKETDRLAATVAELQRLGQTVSHGEDWLLIEPRPLVPAVVECYGDHRMAMAFSVLGLARPGVSIADPACVAKTYPDYWHAIAQCYRAVGQRPSWSGGGDLTSG